VAEFAACQGKPRDIGGYFQPDPALAAEAMRPSETLNEIIAGILADQAGSVV
jgi:isocitrate dehydrogenase